MPGAHLMGFEQEMALCAMGQDGGRIDTESLMPHLFALAAKSLVHLPGVGDGGMFLGNGSRLYQDCGKVEYAGPECSSPDEIVQHLLAAERILAKLADDLSNKPGLADVGLYRCQVDYTSKNSWGAHESYLTRCNPRQLADDLIPFFVARVVTAGAGGFRPLTDTGCSFTLSPRASHIGFPISESSTASRERGIFHLKDESLSVRGYHRLHTIVGDACCSQKQNWLKFAATSIAVALADQQLHPGRDVMLADPVDALRKFASDPTCKAKAKTLAGWEISAIEVQRHYLELARTYLHAPWMAAWAAEAIEQWDAMLHLLEGAPDSVATCLDWGIKYNLFRSHIERSGFDLARLRYWTQATDIVHRCIKATPGAQRNPAPSSRHLS
jgi:proteasome accessory factor A